MQKYLLHMLYVSTIKQPGLCNKGEQLFHVKFCNILLASTSYVLRDTMQLPLCFYVGKLKEYLRDA